MRQAQCSVEARGVIKGLWGIGRGEVKKTQTFVELPDGNITRDSRKHGVTSGWGTFWFISAHAEIKCL